MIAVDVALFRLYVTNMNTCTDPALRWGRGFHMKGRGAHRLVWVFTDFDLTQVLKRTPIFSHQGLF